MHILIFTLLLCAVITGIMALIITAVNNVFSNFFINFACLIIMFILDGIALICPKLIFDEYATYIESDIISTHKVVESNYISKKQDNNTITICYLDKDDKMKTYNIYNDKIIYYEGEPKIEFVNAKYSFLYGTKAIVYLNEE